jgi:hypothetical protein
MHWARWKSSPLTIAGWAGPRDEIHSSRGFQRIMVRVPRPTLCGSMLNVQSGAYVSGRDSLTRQPTPAGSLLGVGSVGRDTDGSDGAGRGPQR